MLRSPEIDDLLVHSRPELSPRLAPCAHAAPDRDHSSSLCILLQNLADEARATLGVHHAFIRVSLDDEWARVVSAASLSEKYSSWQAGAAATNGFGLDSLVCPIPRALRLTQDEVRAHPGWNRLAAVMKNRPPLHGWLAAPLIDRQGRNFGMIELSDRQEGEFTADDELRLVQFSRIAALAVENARLYQSAQPAAPIALGSLHAEIVNCLTQDWELPSVLQACADVMARHTGVAVVRLWVFLGGVMKLHATAGRVAILDDGRSRVPIGQFSAGHIARTRLPLITNSILDHPHIHDKEWSRREGLTAFAGCPLLVDNELVGVIAMFDTKPIFAPTFDAMTAVARDLALAVKHKRVEAPDLPVAAPLSNGVEHAVIISTPDGIIAEWNRGAEKCFGYTRSEVVGRPLAMLATPERTDEHRDLMHRVAQGETVFRPETSRQHKSGRCVEVRLTAAPLRDAGVVLVAHDLGEVKLLQQQHRIAQKMEIFGHLTGGVAHDFNNLLTVILGYSEIVISRLPAGDPVRDLLCEIHKAGERAETLTRQLLAFSRQKMLEPKILDLNAVVSDTEKMLRRLIGEDILMTTIFEPKLRPVSVDPGQMQQVILNLAVNARDAMPRGGRLTIETANVTLDEAYAQAHPDVVPGPYVLFAMSDTGTGMSAATQARIFEPLFTTKGPGKGTGLGLKTVNAIVNQYGGHIHVYSEVNLGSTFKIYLPQAGDANPALKSHPQLRTIPRGNETVLLVEDEDSVRSLARHVLELNGYQVLAAADGEEAVRLAEGHSGAIDLLVADVVMPRLGGRALADRLLTLRPGLKILFLSGYTSEAIVRHGVLDSDHAFLQKPFTTVALAQKVRDALDQPARVA